MGAVITSSEPMLVMEYMNYGYVSAVINDKLFFLSIFANLCLSIYFTTCRSLHDLLRNETMYAGGEIILQIVRDIAQGLRYLHASSPPVLHGDLKAKNILVDSRYLHVCCETNISFIGSGRRWRTLVFPQAKKLSLVSGEDWLELHSEWRQSTFEASLTSMKNATCTPSELFCTKSIQGKIHTKARTPVKCCVRSVIPVSTNAHQCLKLVLQK